MRPLPLSSSPAPRQNGHKRLLVLGLLCASAWSGWAQDLKFSEALAQQRDEAVVELLQSLAQDQLARSPTLPRAAAEGEAPKEHGPELMWVKDISPPSPPPQEQTAAPVDEPAPTVTSDAPVALPPPPDVPATPVSQTASNQTNPAPAPVLPTPDPKDPEPAPAAVPAPAPEPVPAPAAKPLETPPLLAPNGPGITTPTPTLEKQPADKPLAEAPVQPDKGTMLQKASTREGLPPLGVGDQITIAVFGQPDLSAEVTVGESGSIMVPLIGTLNVLNMSAGQLESMVATRLKDGGYLQNPGVSVQIRQLRSQLVSVIGEVQRPGRYPIQGRMTVLEALATAGGLTQRADKTVVLLRKPSTDRGANAPREEIRILLETADGQFGGRLDAPLLNDDVVFVGVQKLFYIHGEVRRPGAYPMEAGMNIMKALSLSGGVSERGSDRRIRIHRLNANKVLQEMKAEPATPLQPDDVVHVDERLF